MSKFSSENNGARERERERERKASMHHFEISNETQVLCCNNWHLCAVIKMHFRLVLSAVLELKTYLQLDQTSRIATSVNNHDYNGKGLSLLLYFYWGLGLTFCKQCTGTRYLSKKIICKKLGCNKQNVGDG